MSKLAEVSKKLGQITRDPVWGTRESDGISKKSFVEISGQKYMIKGDETRETIAEVFSYRFGKKLGMNVLPVFYVENNLSFSYGKNVKILSVHKWHNEFETIAEIFDDGVDDEDIVSSFGFKGLKMLIFDVLINNTDRHQSNYGMLKGSNDLWLIDHGLAKAHRMVDISYDRLRGMKYTIQELLDGELQHRDETIEFLRTIAKITRDDLFMMIADLEKYEPQVCAGIVRNISRSIGEIKFILNKYERGAK